MLRNQNGGVVKVYIILTFNFLFQTDSTDKKRADLKKSEIDTYLQEHVTMSTTTEMPIIMC